MDNGCKMLDSKYRCTKYGCQCEGWISSKKACPVWAEAFAIEEYYTLKLQHDKDVEFYREA